MEYLGLVLCEALEVGLPGGQLGLERSSTREPAEVEPVGAGVGRSRGRGPPGRGAGRPKKRAGATRRWAFSAQPGSRGRRRRRGPAQAEVEEGAEVAVELGRGGSRWAGKRRSRVEDGAEGEPGVGRSWCRGPAGPEVTLVDEEVSGWRESRSGPRWRRGSEVRRPS